MGLCKLNTALGKLNTALEQKLDMVLGKSNTVLYRKIKNGTIGKFNTSLGKGNKEMHEQENQIAQWKYSIFQLKIELSMEK